jgi:hypothetical protein
MTTLREVLESLPPDDMLYSPGDGEGVTVAKELAALYGKPDLNELAEIVTDAGEEQIIVSGKFTYTLE